MKLNRTKRIKGGMLILSAIGVIAAAIASQAYWTDRIDLEETVRSYDMKILYDGAGLSMDEDDPFYPGKTRNFHFTVVNDGDISVDIKPKLTITSSVPMTLGASEFLLVDPEGKELGGYDRVFFNGETPVAEDAVRSGSTYTRVEYTLADEIVLSGFEQTETIAEGQTASDRQVFSYGLRLSERTDNQFMGTGVQLDISTYAIQHRNRSKDTDGIGDDWIRIVQDPAGAEAGTT